MPFRDLVPNSAAARSPLSTPLTHRTLPTIGTPASAAAPITLPQSATGPAASAAGTSARTVRIRPSAAAGTPSASVSTVTSIELEVPMRPFAVVPPSGVDEEEMLRRARAARTALAERRTREEAERAEAARAEAEMQARTREAALAEEERRKHEEIERRLDAEAVRAEEVARSATGKESGRARRGRGGRSGGGTCLLLPSSTLMGSADVVDAMRDGRRKQRVMLPLQRGFADMVGWEGRSCDHVPR